MAVLDQLAGDRAADGAGSGDGDAHVTAPRVRRRRRSRRAAAFSSRITRWSRSPSWMTVSRVGSMPSPSRSIHAIRDLALLLEAAPCGGRSRLGHRDLVDPDGAGGVAEVGLGADRQQPAQHLVGGPLHGRDGGDAEPLVDLGAPGVVDPGHDLLDAEGLAGDARGDDVGVVAAGDRGEARRRAGCRPSRRTSWSKPKPVTLSPLKDGPSRRNESGSLSMTETVWLRSSRLRASVEPTRPQPMITTCTRTNVIPADTAAWRHAGSSLPARGCRRRLQADPAGAQAPQLAARRDAAAQADRAPGVRQRRAVVGGLRPGRDLHHARGRRRVDLRLVVEDRPRGRPGDADRGRVVPADGARLPVAAAATTRWRPSTSAATPASPWRAPCSSTTC